MSLAVDLVQRGVRLLIDAQTANGAFPAAPTFPTYRYCWFRDGSYVAHALDRHGDHEAAARFHRWAEAVILSEGARIEAAVRAPHDAARTGAVLRARYPLDGTGPDEDWPNFQLDGVATWLWMRLDHARRRQEPLAGDAAVAAELVARYLDALWDEPNFDVWEEAGDRRHPSTWGCVLAALGAYADATGSRAARGAAGAVRAALLSRGIRGGAFTKHEGAADVDANLLFLAVPEAVVPLEAELFGRTLARIEAELVHGGVHRYRADSFYGGGEWVVLSGFLGWCYVRLGRRAEAERCLTWMAAQADAEGHLPEQVPACLYEPAMLPVWERRWGRVATPLLWSHAMYLILADELGTRAG